MTVKTDELVALNKIYKIEFKCCLYHTTLSYYLQCNLTLEALKGGGGGQIDLP